MLRVKLSFIINPRNNSNTMASEIVTETGAMRAKKKPITAAKVSLTELIMLSPM